MQVDVRAVESNDATEVFITAEPSAPASAGDQARTVFTAVRDALRDADARIFTERIFAMPATLEVIGPVRSDCYGDLDDGVAPTWLVTPQGLRGPIAGVFVHALRSGKPPVAFPQNHPKPCGRSYNAGDRTYINLSGVSAPGASSACEQARGMLEAAEAALKSAGGSMRSVVRSWLWLGDILAWYGDFNRVRNRFFREHGLLNGHPEQNRMPASTGIGIRPGDRAACSLDLMAVVGGEDTVRFVAGGGNQQSAYNYGSAFSRAARTRTPAGETVFISGTADIDEAGVTQHVGDAAAQIDATLDNVRALLGELQCADDDVVEAVAYCKTLEVEHLFRAQRDRLPWPFITVIADVCRRDLLFEVEATACSGAKRA